MGYMSTKAFKIKGVAKHYGEVKALDGVSLEAEQGQIFSLLGPNGAGKTTIIRILSTLLIPDKGSVEVNGLDALAHPNQVREVIGLAGQYAAVDEYQTGYENVYMTGLLYGLNRREAKQRTTELLGRLDLTEAANRPVRTYSGGMRRRLDLGASLVGEPNILYLDEPTTGLDPKSRTDIWKIIRELVAGGTSILLTTQYLEEADELSDQIAVIDEGKVIAEGTSDQLKQRLGGDIIEFELGQASDQAKALEVAKKFATKPPTFVAETLKVRIPVTNGSKHLMPVVQALNDAKLEVMELSLHRPSLDDVFLSLTGVTAESKATPEPKKKGRRA